MTAYDWANQPTEEDEAHDAAWLEAKEQAEENVKALRRARAQKSARDTVRTEELAQLPIPQPMRLDHFLARPLTPVTHRIEGLWPAGGRVILTAQWKAGKTTMRDEVVRSLVDGAPFLDRYMVTPTPLDQTVVILDFELDDQTLQRWLTDHQIENQDRVLVLPMRGQAATFDIRDPALRARWAETLQTVGAGIIILDCLRPILDALNLDENHDAGLFLVAFDALLNECGAKEALVLHHMGHTGERSRGDSRLRDWPDAEWRLVRDKDQEDPTIDDPTGARYFSAYGRDVNHPQTELTYHDDTRRLSLRQGAAGRKEAAERRKLSHAMQAVQRVVTAQPGIGKAALRTAISGHNPSIDQAVELLVEDGLITRHVQGQKHSYFPGQEPDSLDIPTTMPAMPNHAPGTRAPTVPRPLGMGTVLEAHDNDQKPGHGQTPQKPIDPTLDFNSYLDTKLGPVLPCCNNRRAHRPDCPGTTDEPPF